MLKNIALFTITLGFSVASFGLGMSDHTKMVKCSVPVHPTHLTHHTHTAHTTHQSEHTHAVLVFAKSPEECSAIGGLTHVKSSHGHGLTTSHPSHGHMKH